MFESIVRALRVGAILLLTGASRPGTRTDTGSAEPLRLDVYVADTNTFGVTATLISGPSEAILVDAQYHKTDAARLADRIAATGKQLKAIIITHPHDDHYMGLAVLLARFPGTPVYISAAGLDEFRRRSARALSGLRAYMASEAPDSVVTPVGFPTIHFSVDAQVVDVLEDWQGDVADPLNSIVWIPSLRAAIAGDVVFNGVHPWLANSTERSRAAWRSSLDRLGDLHPVTVVAGHKGDAGLPDTPDAITFTKEYLTAFDSARATTSNADELASRMAARYPRVAIRYVLTRSAQAAFSTPAQPGVGFHRATLTDSAMGQIEFAVWYPTDASPSPAPVGRIREHCARAPTAPECTFIAQHHGDQLQSPPRVMWHSDGRIGAMVIAAPALGFVFTESGLRSVNIPVQVWRAGNDQDAPNPANGDRIVRGLPKRPDVHTVVGAGHFVFLSPCSEALAAVAPTICHDAVGVDRRAVHAEFNATVARFFREAFSKRPGPPA
jgi:glyoxylase-like metal-dependent hydrolase (beta-lactamase superfamily II)